MRLEFPVARYARTRQLQHATRHDHDRGERVLIVRVPHPDGEHVVLESHRTNDAEHVLRVKLVADEREREVLERARRGRFLYS